MTTDTISDPLELSAAGEAKAAGSALGETLRRCAETGRSVFLFGGDAATIRALRERVAADYPRLRIAGICDADFSGPVGQAILTHIAERKPDVFVLDLPSKRHRALIAEVAACGLRFTLINRAGSFARYAAGQGGNSGLGSFIPFRRQVGTLRRFAGIVLRQFMQQSGPRLSARD